MTKSMLAPIHRIYTDKLKSKPHMPTICNADADPRGQSEQLTLQN
jgi:hypothetical protein